MPDGEIVLLFPTVEAADDAHPVTQDPDRQFCLHDKARLDEQARRVFCRECGREVDAFEILAKLARDSSRYVSAREEAKRLADRQRDQLKDVERRIRNAKARARKAKAGWVMLPPDRATELLAESLDRVLPKDARLAVGSGHLARWVVEKMAQDSSAG